MNKYINRSDAGKILAKQLSAYANHKDVIVLALPRGGVPVAYEVATALHLPLDIFIVRKLGVPGHEELAMGAIASGGTIIFNDTILRNLNLSQAQVQRTIQAETKEMLRREHLYRGGRPFPELANKIILLVDDGIATGASMRVAIQALQSFKPASIIVAVPVADITVCENLSKLVDQVVCPLKVGDLYAIGLWYQNFDQTTDEEVHQLLKTI